MSAKFDFNGHKVDILNVHGKPGFYVVQIDGHSSEAVLNTSEMIDRVRRVKASFR